ALVMGIALSTFLTTQTAAAPVAYTTPNVVTTAGATSVTFDGKTFVNQGLQGVARLPAQTTRDFNGDTFGAFSGMDIVPGSWRKTASGYTGVLYSLPDRGPNGIGSVTFSDYAGRVSRFDMNFNPYVSSANLPVSADSQHQLSLTQNGGFFFKDFNGRVTTGLDPGTGATAFVTQNGMNLPGSTVGPAAGKISLDAEGLRFMNNGSFYVSDEYGANVYYFDRTGAMLGVIQPPAALTARAADGSLSYTSLTDATTGRRLNQGLEGMAITPDNKKLVTLLQSAAMQDSNTNQQTRTNTRLMIYDISQTNTPGAPVADYVMQLPVFTSNGNGGAVNRTAAQSEILALNDTQFLVLSRDGNGLGQANLNPVYKSIVLIDTAGATNIAGTAFETTTTPIATNGELNSTIKPVSQVEVVNILNTTQLGKFGININNVAPTQLTLTEKLEGMALVPVLDENAPQDFFLMVGNDNDFLSSTCSVGGQNCAQAVNSDALVLVYRLTLPTYVDSQYLLAMQDGGATTLGMTSVAARDMSTSNADNIAQHLSTLRHITANAAAGRSSGALWVAGNWNERDESSKTTEARMTNVALGYDIALNDSTLVGIAGGYFDGDAESTGGFSADYAAYQLSLYGAYNTGSLYANGTASYGDMTFDDIYRAGAYGMNAVGNTDGSSFAITGEVGYLMQ
ncbi:MAG: esterase-like activity of phytase family protein, partial [Pseudomonadota bacterium]